MCVLSLCLVDELQLPTSHPAAAAMSLQASHSHTPTTPSSVSLCSCCTHTWTHPSGLLRCNFSVEMPAPGVSRSVWCQSPTQPALCTALRRQQAAAVSVFVSHWRRVCAIRPSQAKGVAEASPLQPVAHSLTSAAACPIYFLRKDVPAPTSQSAFFLL